MSKYLPSVVITIASISTAISMLSEVYYIAFLPLPIILFKRKYISDELKLSLLISVLIATSSLSMNWLVLLLWHFRNRSLPVIDKRTGLWSAVIIFHAIVSMILFNVFENVDPSVEIRLYVTNTVKSVVYPILMISILSNYKQGVISYVRSLSLTAFTIVVADILTTIISTDTVELVNIPLSLKYALPLFFFSTGKDKLVPSAAVIGYLYLAIEKDLYVSGSELGIVVISSVMYMMVNIRDSKKFFAYGIYIFIVIYFTMVGNPYKLLTSAGIENATARKLSLALTTTKGLYQSGSSLELKLPRTLQVRWIEINSSMERNALENIFGSGIYATTNELNLLGNISFASSDYTQVELDQNIYYNLHNTARGILHYGFLYFGISFYIFARTIRNKKIAEKDSILTFLSILFMMESLWNPYVHILFIQYWLYKENSN